MHGEGGEAEGECGSHIFPKQKSIDLIDRAVSWQCSLNPRMKIEHISFNYYLFETAFRRINWVWYLIGLVFFPDFFSDIFMCAYFEWTNKIMLM